MQSKNKRTNLFRLKHYMFSYCSLLWWCITKWKIWKSIWNTTGENVKKFS